MLKGRVVLAGARNGGIAQAKVGIAAINTMCIPFAVTADADGRFQAERELDRLVVCATSPDGKFGAIVEVGAEDPEVTIPVGPTATATGLLLDEKGRTAANQQLNWGRRVFIDEEQRISMICFAPKVVTDANGRFTLPALVVGQEYETSVQRDNVYPAAGAVLPEKAGLLDLGTLRVGAYRPKSPAGEEEESSFRKNAPGAGAVAPPINATTLDGKPLTLDDFRGKYALLDFWATWCGPCIAEIPQLRPIHEAFSEDHRFTILSVSVDEKIEEPKRFQEKRKLPWAQAFLAGGMHGTIPGAFGIRAIPAFVLVGPDGKIVARGMRGDDIKKEVARALANKP
jgi:thiol-disulfide isomerase/thioredoxin